MKISELMHRLQILQTQLGDVPVLTVSEGGEEETKLREVDAAERINMGKIDRPRMAVFLDA